MTDPLDDLRRAFEEATPEPDAERRRQTLARAQELFDGARRPERARRDARDRTKAWPSTWRNVWTNAWTALEHGVRNMANTPTSRPVLATVGALAAVGLAALVVSVNRSSAPAPPILVADAGVAAERGGVAAASGPDQGEAERGRTGAVTSTASRDAGAAPGGRRSAESVVVPESDADAPRPMVEPREEGQADADADVPHELAAAASPAQRSDATPAAEGEAPAEADRAAVTRAQPEPVRPPDAGRVAGESALEADGETAAPVLAGLERPSAREDLELLDLPAQAAEPGRPGLDADLEADRHRRGDPASAAERVAAIPQQPVTLEPPANPTAASSAESDALDAAIAQLERQREVLLAELDGAAAGREVVADGALPPPSPPPAEGQRALGAEARLSALQAEMRPVEAASRSAEARIALSAASAVVAEPPDGRILKETASARIGSIENLSVTASSPVAVRAASRAAATVDVPGRPQGGDFSPRAEPDTEAFANEEPSPVKLASEAPVSTFSIDVDTASYSVVRSSLTNGYLPSAESVRVEELVNYFPYAYPPPGERGAPFRPTVTVFETPWNRHTLLMHIGVQGRKPATDDRPPVNLVFLVDTSGSMGQPNKLPLLVQSFRLMVGQLDPADEVAIVTYAGSAGRALAPTPAADRSAILEALDRLHAAGSTAGAAGIQLAYAVAGEMAAEGEVTRVVLATDGDFNVGIQDPGQLQTYIARQRESGVYLSVLGFGRGNLDDATMQALAQNGNGQAAYIDTLAEAQKVLVDQLVGTLFPIANDVKIQVEFNPAVVAEYRLIGYETRALRREDFNNDRVDAGEIGAGHAVTAIYEVTPVGSPAVLHDALRYAARAAEPSLSPASEAASGELAFLRLRYKAPGADTSDLVEVPIPRDAGEASSDQRFAAAIAGFGQLLRNGAYTGDWTYAEAIALAEANTGADRFGYRREAVTLMRLAESLSR